MKKITILIIITGFIVLVSADSVFAAASDWSNINTIYYNPVQDDAANKYLEQAAAELSDHLAKAGKTVTINITAQPATGIFLRVDSSVSSNDEGFKLYTDSNGIYITGRTPLAVRHGAYALLEKLGFRWFFKSSVWNVTPATLINLNLNEIQAPFFFWRYIWSSTSNGQEEVAKWSQRNRLFGSQSYPVYHNYYSIIPKSEMANHPEWFLPENYSGSGSSQLRPDNPDVIAKAIEYVRAQLSKPPSKNWLVKDLLPPGSVPVSPNDGGGWNPPWAGDQTVTDKVFGLANEVAKAIKTEFPGKYVGLYSYNNYSNVPTIPLEPNLLVQIATALSFSPETFAERVKGLVAKGVAVGIYDYLDVWIWRQDAPKQGLNNINQLAWLASKGVRAYNGESGDGWGGRGLTYYLISKRLWNPNENVDNLLDDFYEKAFGPAKELMKRYFEIRDTDTPSLAASFRYLNEAETKAAGDNAVLERIRYLEYYNRFLWLWHNKGIKTLSTGELKNFYTFTTKIRTLYVIFNKVAYQIGVEDSIEKELSARGLTGSDIAALQNFTPPTSAEAAIWMNEALAVFNSVPLSNIVINPRNMDLRALDNQTSPKLEPLYGGYRAILIPSNGNENVTVRVKSDYAVTLEWYEPSANWRIDTWSSGGPIDWTPVNFRAELPGTYILYVTRIQPTSGRQTRVDVPNRPAAILAAPGTKIFTPEKDNLLIDAPAYMWGNKQYFYVPQNTPSFIFGVGVDLPGSETYKAFGKLTDPNGVEYPFDYKATTEKTFNSPTPGLWKIDIDMGGLSISRGQFWLRDIPPLVWHDPKYLLIPVITSLPSPIYNTFNISNINQLHLFRDKTNLLPISGSNFNLATNFNIQFIQNSNPVSTFTFQPKDISTLELDLDSAKVNTLPIGFYDLKITRTADSVSQTFAKQILVTTVGDLWSSTATESSEQKRDGKVNIFDVSRLLSKWGSSQAADLAEADINAGPNNISAGKIDLYDANKLMANWKP